MTEHIETILGILVTTSLTFFLTRKKYSKEVNKIEAETNHIELDNIEQATKIWRDLSTDLNTRLTAEIKMLREENEMIKKQFHQVFEENSSLKISMMNLEVKLQEATCANGILLKELRKFNKYYPDSLTLKPDKNEHPDT